MTRPRNYQTEAIIIKKTKLGEADRILTLYTPHLGKIQVVAKGVRRPRSKLSGHLELLTHSLVSLARGKNLDTVTGSQTIDSFLPLKSNIELTSYALYVTELVNQFTAENAEDYDLFGLLLETFKQLCQSQNNGAVLRYFELHLLHEAGYRPQLECCVRCRSQLETVTSAFSPSAGGILCSRCITNQFAHPLSVSGLKMLRLLQESNYNIISQLEMERGLSVELERIMRGYIRYLLEREIKSAAWLDALKEQASGRY
jgi:DNA repair protein RecO (recombination protein O)